jgi:electron transport complex protein RnfC
MRLIPASIANSVIKEDYARAEMYGAIDCFECGCCSYVCPAYIPHVTYVRQAKGKIAALKKR